MRSGGLKFDLDSKTRSKGKIWTKDECQDLIDRFNSGYPMLAQWVTRTQNKAKKLFYTSNIFGRRRPLPELKSEDWYERLRGIRMSVNAPI